MSIKKLSICSKLVFVFSIKNINNFGRILTQFTGLLQTRTVAAKRCLLTERTCLGKSVSVALRKNGLGCNNDIGGFHENLVTFWDPELPSFLWAQKMCLKKCRSRCNKKSSKSGSMSPKCKMAENFLRIDCHRPKIGLNPNFLGYSNSS